MMAEVALHLEQRLRALKGHNKVIRLDHAFSAFSGDIIARICLDSGDSESGFLNDPQFAPDWYVVVQCPDARRVQSANCLVMVPDLYLCSCSGTT